jgi:ribosome-associated toxin RatA of RatAB toxin-antitoxin module
MAVLSGSSSAEVTASIERCWALVADVADAPSWQNGLERVDVLERDERGRALIADTVNDAKLFKVSCRVRFIYDEPRRLSFTQVQSDDLDSMQGTWELEAIDAGLTRVTYTLEVDPGPVGMLARPLVRLIRPLVVGDRARELVAALARPA